MQYKTQPSRRCFDPMKTVLMPAVAALLAITGARAQEDAADEANLTPRVIGTAALPLSESDAVALLADERVACVADSYETRVRCVDVEGTVVGVFGRKGEGPGEFESAAYLARGEDGTVGVHDPGLGRFTVFEPSGALVSDVPAPLLDVPFRSFGAVLSGVEVDIMVMLGRASGSRSLMTRYDVDIATGEVVREEASPPGPWDVPCGEDTYGVGQVAWGIPDRTGGWAFLACDGHLIFVGNTGDATVLRAPTYLAELPNERDVARYEEALMALNVRNGFPASTDLEENLESYRAEAKKYFLGTLHQLVDATNRYWVATQRDTHEWSYLDVYENAEYVRTVKVRDRLRGFDLVGSTLVVLVDRQLDPDDADGIPDRALDWYDVRELGLGR